VLVDKLTPRFDPYNRGDIVVFEPPEDWVDSGTPFIKRVIGEPGDVVSARNGHVIVNGVRIAEPYLHERTARFPETTVPAGELFVMGDNRSNSLDSRFTLGFVPIDRVVGKAVWIIWPLENMGGF
jgi:signal peptidase I